MDRRREQNRQAQRRYRQRQQQLGQKTIHVHYLPPGASPDSPSPSFSSTVPPVAPSTTVETLTPTLTPGSDRLFPPAAASRSTSKSFCDTIADGVNLVLDGLGTIDMDGIQLPNPYSTPQMPSPLAHWDVPDTQHPSSTALQTYQLSISPDTTCPNGATSTNENIGQEPSLAASGGWLSPLHMAARKGRDKIVQSLLQHNANCNLGDSDGLTPLMHATIGGFRDVITLLLSHGASIEQTDPHGRSVLHWAVIEKQEASLKVLLDKGAENQLSMIDKHDDSGKTPLHLAIEADFEAGVQLLLQFGADVDSQGRQEVAWKKQ